MFPKDLHTAVQTQRIKYQN